MAQTYRFHQPLADTSHEAAGYPFLLRKRRKQNTNEAAYYLAADSCSITDERGTRSIEKYEPRMKNSYVLTRREVALISVANPGAQPPRALEDLHSWLPDCAYLPNSKQGYRALQRTLNRYSRHFFEPSAFCDDKWNTICNSLRRKTSWDERFYSAWHSPIQDTFVLEETRKSRNVIALDINAMYSACLQHAIPHPAHLKRREVEGLYDAGMTLRLGLYRCRLEGPKTPFIRDHNPFTAFYNGKRMQADLSEPLQIDLNEFEIEYFSAHFQTIYIVDAVVSEKGVSHPLAKEARRSFARRMHFQAQGRPELANREKLAATFLASCSSRPVRSTHRFANREDAFRHLEISLGFNPPGDEPTAAVEDWLLKHPKFDWRQRDGAIELSHPDATSPHACHMLNQRVVAHGRVLVLQLMEHILSLDSDIQICYSNIDSVHFSLPSASLPNVLEQLKAEAVEQMGSFKIEAVTTGGLWLEPGRYWLYGDKVEKFRNRGVSSDEDPFKTSSYHLTSRELGDLHIPMIMLLRMERSMSNLRALQTGLGGLEKQRRISIGAGTSFRKYIAEVDHEGRSATARRVEAFKSLRDRLDLSCRAASTTGK